jgi:hypothetical protein
MGKLSVARRMVDELLLSDLKPKTCRWPCRTSEAHFPLALRHSSLALSGISCLLCVRLLCDTSRFESHFMPSSLVLLLPRCSSASVPLRSLRAQDDKSRAALAQRESAMRAISSAASAAAQSANRVAQAVALVEKKKIIAAQAATEVLAAEADLLAAREAENVTKLHYEQSVTAADAEAWRVFVDQDTSCADDGGSRSQHLP